MMLDKIEENVLLDCRSFYIKTNYFIFDTIDVIFSMEQICKKSPNNGKKKEVFKTENINLVPEYKYWPSFWVEVSAEWNRLTFNMTYPLELTIFDIYV